MRTFDSMKEVLPTNTCPPTLTELERRSQEFAAFAPHVHLDISDGKFTPVISWPFLEGQGEELDALAFSKLPLSHTLTYEVHLMVSDPLPIGMALAKAGAHRIIAHVEAFKNPEEGMEVLTSWKESGAKEVGLAITISTSLEEIAPYVPHVNSILVMTISEIGNQGNPFQEHALERISSLHALYPDTVIAADGGVSHKNIADVARAGASRFCVGSAISKEDSQRDAYERLLHIVGAV